jgi:hypothetical protein
MLSTQSRKRILALAFAMLALPVLVATPLGCSLFGIQAEENPAYQTSFEQDDFEVRNYEPVLVAQTIVPGDYRAAGDAAFKRLADYIFGKNTTSEKMDMTAPVIQKEQGEKMEMTAPVLQRPEGEGWLMQFVMPSKYTPRDAPQAARSADRNQNTARAQGRRPGLPRPPHREKYQRRAGRADAMGEQP